MKALRIAGGESDERKYFRGRGMAKINLLRDELEENKIG